MVEKYTWMTSDRCFTAPAVAFGISAEQRGTGLSARGTNARTRSTDDVVKGLTVWSPPV